MSLVTTKEIVQDAYKKGYGVAAINTQGGNYDIIRAICEAAEETRSPIILAMYVNNVHYYGMEWFAEVSKYFAKKVSVPVAVHLDHGDTFESCMRAIKYGFTSVMIDGSMEPIEKNIQMTNEVIKAAHAVGVSVEAEVGELARLDEEGKQMPNKNIASMDDIKRFLEGCTPDLLAVGIGNAHGFYKGKPELHFELLESIKGICDIPLVLHGSTGIPDEDIKRGIELGIAKVNFGTLVRYQCMNYYKEAINTLDHKGHIWMVAKYAEEKLKEDIKQIIYLLGSNDRY